MSMRAIDLILRHFDDAWSHRWESLSSALDGVTEDEAAYQAPCYAADPAEAGWPPPGTIAWQVAHLAHCKRYYGRVLRSVGRGPRPEVAPRIPRASFADERAALDAAHAAQRSAIADLDDEALDADAGGGMTVGEFLAGCLRHDTWHAGQIAVARRLFREAAPPPARAGGP
jgi:uncharacterized damage-inducible protein DinB